MPLSPGFPRLGSALTRWLAAALSIAVLSPAVLLPYPSVAWAEFSDAEVEAFYRGLDAKQRASVDALAADQRSRVLRELMTQQRLGAAEPAPTPATPLPIPGDAPGPAPGSSAGTAGGAIGGTTGGAAAPSSESPSAPPVAAPSSDAGSSAAPDSGSEAVGASGGSWTDHVAFEDGRSLLYSYSMTAGLFVEAGGTEFSDYRGNFPSNPTTFGLRYYERNGVISGTISAIVMIVGGAMAASGPKSVETWESGGYRYTKTTYRSPAEKAAIMAASSAAAVGLFSVEHQSFDLQVYSRNIGGHTDGWKANMMFGIPFAERWLFDLGFGMGAARSTVGDGGKYLISNRGYLGMPFRLSVALGPVVTFAHWEWNWAAHYSDEKTTKTGALTEIDNFGHPIRLGAQAAMWGRLFLEAALTTPSPTSGAFGFSSTIGARF